MNATFYELSVCLPDWHKCLVVLGEMTVDELMKQYSGGAYDSDFEAELAGMSGDDEGTPDDTEEEDDEEDEEAEDEGGCWWRHWDRWNLYWATECYLEVSCLCLVEIVKYKLIEFVFM